MKRMQSTIHCLVACGVALAMVSSLAAQTVIEGKAKVVRVKGSARYTTGNNVWQPLSAGAVLKPGTIVQTSLDKGSFVDIVLGDGEGVMPIVYNPAAGAGGGGQATVDQNVVRLWENTVLGIDKLTSMDTGADTVTDTQLDLRAGHIFGNVKKMNAASKYEVKVPNGVAGIRGTIYDLNAEGLLKVRTGSVVIATVDKAGAVKTQVVGTNQKYDPSTGEVTALPVSEQQDLEVISKEASVGITPRVTMPAPDPTIRFISGNKGKHKGKGQPPGPE